MFFVFCLAHLRFRSKCFNRGSRRVFCFFACLLGPDSLRSTTSVKWVTFSKKQTRRSLSRFPSFLFYTHMITIISTSWTGVTDIHPGASWEGTGGIFRHTKIARCIYTKESPFFSPSLRVSNACAGRFANSVGGIQFHLPEMDTG